MIIFSWVRMSKDQDFRIKPKITGLSRKNLKAFNIVRKNTFMEKKLRFSR